MPVALITAADGVCHPTSAALIIGRQRRQGRQGRRSIYPDRQRHYDSDDHVYVLLNMFIHT